MLPIVLSSATTTQFKSGCRCWKIVVGYLGVRNPENIYAFSELLTEQETS